MTILIYGPAPVSHEYLLNTYGQTRGLLVISSNKKLQEEWKSLPCAPTVINPQTPKILEFVTNEHSHVIIEQAQSFKNVSLESIFASHKQVVYTHSHLLKQFRPDEVKRFFTQVIVTKTRYFSTIASIFAIPLEYGEQQVSGSVQVFSNTGTFIRNETPMKIEHVSSVSSVPSVPSVPDMSSVPSVSSVQSVPGKKFMSLTITMNSQEKNALISLTKRFSKNVFAKDIRVFLKNPATETYVVEVEHEPEHGAMVCIWLYHLSSTITTDIPSQTLHISFMQEPTGEGSGQ
jgi:hypothetical protein